MARGGTVITTGGTAKRVQDQRNRAARSISLDKLIPYHRENVDGQPIFKDYSIEKLNQLADSIEKHGQVDNIIVFPSEMEPGYYEILSGKQRTRAARIVRDRNPNDPTKATIKATILDLKSVKKNNYAFGDLTYVLTNVHRRDNISISEYGMAYEMQFQAEKHQGTSSESGMETIEKIAEQNKTSTSFVKCARQFIPKLCIEEIIELADNGFIPVSTASQTLTRMNKKTQKSIYEFIEEECEKNKTDIGVYCKKKLKTPVLKCLKQIYDEKLAIAESKDEAILNRDDLSLLDLSEKKANDDFNAPSKKFLRTIIPKKYWGRKKDAEEYLMGIIEELKKYKEKYGEF